MDKIDKGWESGMIRESINIPKLKVILQKSENIMEQTAASTQPEQHDECNNPHN